MSNEKMIMQQAQNKIFYGLCIRENNYEYESANTYDLRSFESLCRRGLAEFIDAKDSVYGNRIHLTAKGILIHDKIHSAAP